MTPTAGIPHGPVSKEEMLCVYIYIYIFFLCIYICICIYDILNLNCTFRICKLHAMFKTMLLYHSCGSGLNKCAGF